MAILPWRKARHMPKTNNLQPQALPAGASGIALNQRLVLTDVTDTQVTYANDDGVTFVCPRIGGTPPKFIWLAISPGISSVTVPLAASA